MDSNKNMEFRLALSSILEDMDPESRRNAEKDIYKIFESGINSFDDMINYLRRNDADLELCSVIYWIFGKLDDDRFVPCLLEGLNSVDDEKLIWEIAKSLSELASNSAVQSLISIISESSSTIRRAAAAYTLGRLAGTNISEVLIGILNNRLEDELVRSHAAESLGLLRDAKSVDSLINAIDDPSVSVRFWSAYALGEIGDDRALPALLRLVDHDDAYLEGWWSVKKEAADAIDKILKKE